MSRDRRKLLRLLERNGFEQTTVNALGAETWQLSGCRDVIFYRNSGAASFASLTKQVNKDLARHDPENTNAAAQKQAAWEQENAERVAREKADAARVAPLRLGGIAAVLTEAEVDAIEARINHNLQAANTIRRAMRHHPNNDIRI